MTDILHLNCGDFFSVIILLDIHISNISNAQLLFQYNGCSIDQLHQMWSVFLYSWYNTLRWTLFLYPTLLYVTIFLYHAYYRLARYIKCGQSFSIPDIIPKGGYFFSILLCYMWQFFSMMLTIAWPAAFNVVSFSLLLI